MRSFLLVLLAVLAVPLSRTLGQSANSVTLAHQANGRWRATYRLSAPVTSFSFERQAGFFRERVWSVVTPGYRLARDAERQVVRLDSGATAQRELKFEFPEYTSPLPKEYELFLPFSGGAAAVYTGHFYGSAIRATNTTGNAAADATARAGAGTGADADLTVRTIIVDAPRGGHAIIRGRVNRSRVTFTDSTGEGTYIYLGTTKPIETPDVVAVVDPAMPAWLMQQFSLELPKLFAAYRQRFAYALPWKPVVLYSFHDTASSGLSSGGGTLTGQVTMTLTGANWKDETPAAVEQAFYLIAHESAHLWNGQLIANVDQRAGSWMHEGSADAFASEIMLSLGIIDSTRFRGRLEDALNRCARGVAAGSVATAMSRGAIKDVYDCGWIVSAWSAAALRRVTPAATLFTLWHDLIAAARTANNTYDQSRYFDVLQRNGVSATTVTAMRTFLASRDSLDVAVAGLNAAGMPVAAGRGAPPAAFQLELARAAMVHLMSQSCRRLNFSFGVPIRTGAIANCAPFASDLQVFGIGGHAVRDDGAQLYDAVREACAANGRVTLEGEDRHEISRVPCNRPLAPRPAWYQLTPP